MSTSTYATTDAFKVGDILGLNGREYRVTKVNRVTLKTICLNTSAPATIKPSEWTPSELVIKESADNTLSLPTPPAANETAETAPKPAVLHSWDFNKHQVFSHRGKDFFVIEVARAKIIVIEMATGKELVFRLSNGISSAAIAFREPTEAEREQFIPKPVLVGAVVQIDDAICRRFNYEEGTLFFVAGLNGTACRLIPVGGDASGRYLRNISFNAVTEVQVIKK